MGGNLVGTASEVAGTAGIVPTTPYLQEILPSAPRTDSLVVQVLLFLSHASGLKSSHLSRPYSSCEC